MARARRCTIGVLRQLIGRSTVGFHSKSFRFEGGGRFLIGLKRTGKSCRLRWVNYLHPDLKSGKMTPQEERLVLELHSKWGNRWSRIAGKLPGRTDNEIKNYWRTHMRKEAQEKRKAMSNSSSSSSSNSSSITNPSISNTISEFAGSSVTPMTREVKKTTVVVEEDQEHEEDWKNKVYSLDEIWKDFEMSTSYVKPPFQDGGYGGDGESYFSGEIMGSPMWDVSSLWGTYEKESMMFPPTTTTSDQLYSFYNQDIF